MLHRAQSLEACRVQGLYAWRSVFRHAAGLGLDVVKFES